MNFGKQHTIHSSFYKQSADISARAFVTYRKQYLNNHQQRKVFPTGICNANLFMLTCPNEF